MTHLTIKAADLEHLLRVRDITFTFDLFRGDTAGLSSPCRSVIPDRLAVSYYLPMEGDDDYVWRWERSIKEVKNKRDLAEWVQRMFIAFEEDFPSFSEVDGAYYKRRDRRGPAIKREVMEAFRSAKVYAGMHKHDPLEFITKPKQDQQLDQGIVQGIVQEMVQFLDQEPIQFLVQELDSANLEILKHLTADEKDRIILSMSKEIRRLTPGNNT